jgi:D-glycero-beta-D-manno-heptose 1-phosphate adenylyltransferase
MPDIPQSLARKILPTSGVDSLEWQRPLVFTDGVFDVLHRGHVTYLTLARALGAALLIGVNSDTSARKLAKGPGRPLNREGDRLLVLAGLESVSYVTLFDELTPCELIERCRPDVYVKGGDYDIETLAETRLVRRWGGRAVAIPFVEGYSTTALVQRIRATPGRCRSRSPSCANTFAGS